MSSWRVWILLIFIPFICSEKLVSWTLQSSAEISASGSVISNSDFNDSSWYPITIPATVLAGLLQNNVYKDPFYGENLLTIPTSHFDVPWWYRCTFPTPFLNVNQFAIISFHGINYKANVWFNGKLLSDVNSTVGSFRYFDFDVTSLLNKTNGGINTLALEIYRPHNDIFKDVKSTDLSMSFIDWAPYPPDQNMGIWQDVFLTISGPLTVRYPMVETILSGQHSSVVAHLTVMAEVSNLNTQTSISGTLIGFIESIGSFQQQMTLNPSETKQIFFSNSSFPNLNVKNPDLWWPWQMGNSSLHTLNFTLQVNSQVSDTLKVQFGIRQMSSALDSNKRRYYQVNGKNILIRGAGWAPELFQRFSRDQQLKHFNYIRDMNLNAVRLEGKFENDEYFNIADRMGILTLPGIACCDAWQHWKYWGQDQFQIASESVRCQVKRLRIHASILVFMYSSDQLPPQNIEKLYLGVFQEEHWPNPLLSTASDYTSSITGPSGVKMSGPYSWVPPNYWLLDTDSFGGAYGFLTEGGPGENPLTFESFNLTVPQSKLWPINDYWNFHCGNPQGLFRDLRFFTPPLEARYGKAKGVEDYLEKSQVATYESHRAMFEGYSRNKYTSTGLIQWMLNNAFPEMIWHLYDFYWNQGGAYFGSKKACEPIHIQYSPNDGSIWIVNSLYRPIEANSLMASIQVLSSDGNVLYSKSLNISSRIDSDGTKNIFKLPSIQDLTPAYFLYLQLFDNHPNIISRNVYWLSKQEDVLDWAHSNWYTTPCSSYADFTSLQNLPAITLKITSHSEKQANNQTLTKVSLTNPTNHVAFFVRIRLLNHAGNDILPIFWNDNYVTLFANESIDLDATYDSSLNTDPEPTTIVELFNNISGK